MQFWNLVQRSIAPAPVPTMNSGVAALVIIGKSQLMNLLRGAAEASSRLAFATVRVTVSRPTVQPENVGQGLITVQGIRFPAKPPAPPQPARRPARVLPPDPPVIAKDGDSVRRELPKPTGPLSPFFPTPFDGPGTVTIPSPWCPVRRW